MKRRRPIALALAAAVVVVALFVALGVWQIQRAQDKHALEQRLARDQGEEMTRLPEGPAALRQAAYARVRLEGRLQGERQFLLDNRIREGQPGFDVLTPLVLGDGRTVLVDRGWVAMGPQRRPKRSIALEGERRVEVEGRLWHPDPGIGLGAVQARRDDWPRLITRIEYPVLEQALARDLVPVVIRADGGGEWLFTPRGLEPTFGPQRHYGYAFQWFALALTVIVIATVLLIRRDRRALDE